MSLELTIGGNEYHVLTPSSDIERISDYLKAQFLYPVDGEGKAMQGMNFNVRLIDVEPGVKSLDITPSSPVHSYSKRAEAKMPISDSFSIQSEEYSESCAKIRILLRDNRNEVTEKVNYTHFFAPMEVGDASVRRYVH
ncbi:MAG TPA: hypothetical protein HA282_01360 [Nanoarchaeota archaeon]|nr:MAG: hypothetical protein QT01_C0003G0014 [archaeon GW2011_AR6]MBS3082371.1 hypothetical protein [Candidatus Pacearchaeota archaeon]HIH18327.1 hypothetical protein [Nanoarchaeota archaeon]HIH33868.1 hypothetical protein [Nanoarchaeota archaeon]HIH51192.1 hypothetical protein [Nanoarchaeota archaeon]